MRNNNFDAIRLLLAFSVFLSHSYPISGDSSLKRLSYLANAAIAVQCFFIISGFLIFMSYDNSRSLRDYFRKRALRIYPAYFTIVVLCAIAGTIVTTVPLREFFAGPLQKYLVYNLAFLNYLCPSLPGVFDTNPTPVINGALWTIKIEAMFYVSVPLITALLRRVPRIPFLLALYAGSLVYRVACERTGHYSLAVQLPGQMSFFVGGALIYFYFDTFKQYATRMILPALIITGVELWAGLMILYPLCLGVIVIYAACFLPVFNRFRPKWDISYGTYIFHFPVLQVMTTWGWFARGPLIGLFSSAIVVLVLGCLSWVLVERRFLKKRKGPAVTPSPQPPVSPSALSASY